MSNNHLRGERMSKQGILSYRIEADNASTSMTGMAGLGPYLDLIVGSGLLGSIRKNLTIRKDGQGWTDAQVLVGLVLLNLAGGDSVEDIDRLEADKGLVKLIEQYEGTGLSRVARWEMERRWRKERTRGLPSSNAIRRYLSEFESEGDGRERIAGKAYIPEANEHLVELRKVNADLTSFADRRHRSAIATLDCDATLIEVTKAAAKFCYKHYRAYQPYNVYWAERRMMVHSEFRDGNVPAGYDQVRVFEEATRYLPSWVKRLRTRMDTAGNDHKLLRYFECGENKRFGRIEFAIGCDVTAAFREAVRQVEESEWQAIYKVVDGKREKTQRQWAEVCFVPNKIGHSLKSPTYRYMATREPLRDQPLPGMEGQISLPFQTMRWNRVSYKVFGMVSNMDWEGEELIRFHDGRCGKAEEAHKILKEDFAGGTMPSGEFGANAAWWQIAILAMNLNSIMEHEVLGGEWAGKRMKAIRYWVVCVPGRIVERGRQIYLKMREEHRVFGVLLEMRRRILELACGPPLVQVEG